jgi:hypothetical protein
MLKFSLLILVKVGEFIDLFFGPLPNGFRPRLPCNRWMLIYYDWKVIINIVRLLDGWIKGI